MFLWTFTARNADPGAAMKECLVVQVVCVRWTVSMRSSSTGDSIVHSEDVRQAGQRWLAGCTGGRCVHASLVFHAVASPYA